MGALLQKLAALDLEPATGAALIDADKLLGRAGDLLYQALAAKAIGQPFQDQAETLLGRLRDFGVPITTTIADRIAETSPVPVATAAPDPPLIARHKPVPMTPVDLDTVVVEPTKQAALTPEQCADIQRLIDYVDADPVRGDQYGVYVDDGPQPWVPAEGGVARTIGERTCWIGQENGIGRVARLSHRVHGRLKRIPLP